MAFCTGVIYCLHVTYPEKLLFTLQPLIHFPGYGNIDAHGFRFPDDISAEGFHLRRFSGVNIPLESALDLGWEILAECFEPNETGLKTNLIKERWPDQEAVR